MVTVLNGPVWHGGIFQRRSLHIISAVVTPVISGLVDGGTVGDALSANIDQAMNYASTAGTISTVVVAITVNGVSATTATEVEAGDAVEVSVTVTDSAANTRVWTRSATAAATVPAQFGTGHWSMSFDGSTMTLKVGTLPDDGGAALSDLEYCVDGGAAVSLGAATTGDYTITATTGQVVNLRAVNAAGAGAWSGDKTAPAFDPLVAFAGDLAGYWNFTQTSGLHTDLAGTTAVTAYGDPIRSANDLSPTGNRLNSQLTTAAPTWVENGGKPGAYFAAAAGERLIRNAGVIGVPTGISAQDEITVVVVAQANTQANMLNWNDGGVGGSNDYIIVPGDMSVSSIRAQATTGEIMVNNTTAAQTAGTEHVVFMEKSGGVGRHYLDNVLQETDPPSGSFGTWSLTLDGNLEIRLNDGIAFAILVIRRALTTSERNGLHAWANDLAGIA